MTTWASPSAPRVPTTLKVKGGIPLVGTTTTPGDKSISHRVLLIGALAEGVSVARGLSDGDDVARSAQAIEALGAQVTRRGQVVEVVGGRRALHPAPGDIDCGNSGTTMRLLSGVVATLPWTTTLVGDSSLSGRPMDRVAAPLSAMGAQVQGKGAGMLPPLVLRGGGLTGIEWTPPMASSQVKSSILLAGTDAQGETVLNEPVPTRAHTEELLTMAGARISVSPWKGGRQVRIQRSELHPIDIDVPGDPSQSAFWVVAGCIIPGSEIVVENIYCGAERIGFVRVLQRMGADVEIRPSPSQVVGDIAARHRPLVATTIEAQEIPSLDEVPILAVAALTAAGVSVFRNVGELRVKESDRLVAVANMVQAFGGTVEVHGDDLAVHGIGPSQGPSAGTFDAKDDHRLAMAATIAALSGGPGASHIAGFAGVATSYPRFLDDLERLAGPSLVELDDQ